MVDPLINSLDLIRTSSTQEALDVPAAPVFSLDDYLNDAPAKNNRIVEFVDSPVGPIRTARYPRQLRRP